MKKLVDLGRWIVKSLFPQARPARFRSAMVEELPDTVDPHVLYGVGAGTPWAAALLCPCNCGSLIQLSLLERERPHWSLSVARDGSPTLDPSVWRTKECGAHFFLRNGEVVWAKAAAAPRRRKPRSK